MQNRFSAQENAEHSVALSNMPKKRKYMCK